jgi:hypothetical protein
MFKQFKHGMNMLEDNRLKMDVKHMSEMNKYAQAAISKKINPKHYNGSFRQILDMINDQ